MSHKRREEILEAAGNCFVEFGYDKTALDDIALQVGINKASFYYYFKNKETIFEELITKEADQFIQSVIEKIRPVQDCKKHVLAWVDESLKISETNSILHKLSLESLKKLTPMLIKLKNYSKQKGIE